jgi:hypothetical protein
MLSITSNISSIRSYILNASFNNPLSLAGCFLWLDNDSLYSDTSCTTLCTNTQAVKGWFDKSVSANHATNATSAFTCLTNHASFNGKSVFNYPSVTSNTNIGLLFSQPTLLPYSNSTCTIFIVFLTSNASNSSMMLSIGPASGHRQINTSGGICYMDKNGGAMVNSGTSSITLNQPYITCFTSGSTQNGYRNGNIFSTSGSASQFTNGVPTGRVGSNINGITTDGLRGAIAEIIIYNTILSTSNQAIIENYLLSKYALSSDITTGLIMHYKCTTAKFTASNLYNEITASYDGACTGISTMSSTYPSALGDGSYLNLLSASSQYVTLPSFNLTSYTQGMSLSCWVLKHTTPNNHCRFLQIVSGGFYSGGTSALNTTSSMNSTIAQTYSATNFFTKCNTNEWYHLVFTTTSTASFFYINGGLATQFGGSAPGNFVTSLSSNTGYIGRAGNGAVNANFGVCDYRLYNRALSGVDVTSLYNYRP